MRISLLSSRPRAAAGLPRHPLQPVFAEEILAAHRIDPGYANTNEVWSVATPSGECVVRLLGHSPDGHAGAFWYGLDHLFGCRPLRELASQPKLAAFLRRHGSLPTPAFLAVEPGGGALGRPYTIAEKMPGDPVPLFSARCRQFVASSSCMAELGRHTARLHSLGFRRFGSFPSTVRRRPDRYPSALAATLEALAKRYWADSEIVRHLLPRFVEEARRMPAPTGLGLMMPDLSPSQFLMAGDSISALVDLESYVRGPAELELVAFELWMRDETAFRAAYEEVAGELPDLSRVRTLYRFFLYLLYRAPPFEIEPWLEAPIVFAPGRQPG